VPTSSKRTSSFAAAVREPTEARSSTESVTEPRRPAVRVAAAPRPLRGASAIPPPRKAELHRVAPSSRPLPTHEQIARRAYEIWVQSGHLTGRDTENWAQAERELSAGCAAPQSSAQQA
jgi:Protein of unknown function (DUF2934)